VKLGEAVYFFSCTSPARTTCRLYRMDGTTAGTLPVNPEDTSAFTAWSLPALAGGRLYFAAAKGLRTPCASQPRCSSYPAGPERSPP
jgi:hypothetical protein